jgi:hypothetical protein
VFDLHVLTVYHLKGTKATEKECAKEKVQEEKGRSEIHH